MFYPTSLTDDFNNDLKNLGKLFIKKNKLKIGKNVLIGKNVSIGKGTFIGHNTIIENNVVIGDNCSIGSNVILRNSIIKKNVHILDGCIIGNKGFGFFPNKNINFRYPHIGYVIINDNCEIGAGSTIDRGSLSFTSIGKNTFFDNQVHIGHNVHIGKDCIISAQVAIGGSTKIYNNVILGGQSGIIDNLEIHDNAIVGPKSFIVKSVKEGSYVSGNPAMPHKDNIKKNIFLSKLPEIYKDLLK